MKVLNSCKTTTKGKLNQRYLQWGSTYFRHESKKLLSDAELDALQACRSAEEWNHVCQSIKTAHGGKYPVDWHDKTRNLFAQASQKWTTPKTGHDVNPELSSKCLLCGKLTTGSIGASGIRWKKICQSCKDKEDEALRTSVGNQVKMWDTQETLSFAESHLHEQQSLSSILNWFNNVENQLDKLQRQADENGRKETALIVTRLSAEIEKFKPRSPYTAHDIADRARKLSDKLSELANDADGHLRDYIYHLKSISSRFSNDTDIILKSAGAAGTEPVPPTPSVGRGFGGGSRGGGTTVFTPEEDSPQDGGAPDVFATGPMTAPQGGKQPEGETPTAGAPSGEKRAAVNASISISYAAHQLLEARSRGVQQLRASTFRENGNSILKTGLRMNFIRLQSTGYYTFNAGSFIQRRMEEAAAKYSKSEKCA